MRPLGVAAVLAVAVMVVVVDMFLVVGNYQTRELSLNFGTVAWQSSMRISVFIFSLSVTSPWTLDYLSRGHQWPE